MSEDQSTTGAGPRAPSDPPEPPPSPQTDMGSRVQDVLRLGGGTIAVFQSIVFPLVGIPISLPALTIAGTMMAAGQMVKITRERGS